MYTAIGQVTDKTVSELRLILNTLTWEHHVSDKTDHQAAPCDKQVQAVDEIVARWPVSTWDRLSFFRLKPGGKLYRHADEGYGFHIPVETNRRAVCTTYENGFAADQNLELGKIYSVDRSIDHAAANYGKTDRTHLIVLLKGDHT